MRLTNIQLIHAAHHAARYLPKASAELVRELATRLDVALVAQREAAKQRDALAAENAALKKYICDECYVENVRTGHYACAGHGMPSTPATDSFLAEVRASTLEDLAKKKRAEKMSLHPDTFALGSVIAALDMQANELEDLAHQLRQDANTTELVAAGIITRIEG